MDHLIDYESLAAMEREQDNLLPISDFRTIRRSAPRRPQRRELSLADKVEFIKFYESAANGGLSVNVIANKFGICKTAALRILKRKEEHLKQYSSNASSNQRRVQRHCKFQEVNSCIWKWFCVARLKQLPVTGPTLREKAKRFAGRLGVAGFKASNGWLGSFKRCYNITKLMSRQPAESGDLNSNFDWTSKLPRLTGDYGPEDVFALKAVTLYFRALPLRSALDRVRRREDDDDGLPEERITLLLCCSATGEKVPPWAVATSSPTTPCSDVTVRVAPDGALSREVLAAFLDSLNDRLRRQCRKVILFQDHMFLDVPEMSHVTTQFFPINVVARSNPIDLGIDGFVKTHFRLHLLRSLADPVGQDDLPLSDALARVGRAWEALETDLVSGCFGDAGFTMPHHVVPPRAAANLRRELQETIDILYEPTQRVDVDDYVTFDRVTVTDNQSEEDWEEQIVAEVLSERAAGGATVASPGELLSVNLEEEEEEEEGELMEFGVVQDEGKVSPLPGSDMSIEEVLEVVCRLRNFASARECRLLPLLDNLRGAVETIVSERVKIKKIVSNDFL